MVGDHPRTPDNKGCSPFTPCCTNCLTAISLAHCDPGLDPSINTIFDLFTKYRHQGITPQSLLKAYDDYAGTLNEVLFRPDILKTIDANRYEALRLQFTDLVLRIEHLNTYPLEELHSYCDQYCPYQ